MLWNSRFTAFMQMHYRHQSDLFKDSMESICFENYSSLKHIQTFDQLVHLNSELLISKALHTYICHTTMYRIWFTSDILSPFWFQHKMNLCCEVEIPVQQTISANVFCIFHDHVFLTHKEKDFVIELICKQKMLKSYVWTIENRYDAFVLRAVKLIYIKSNKINFPSKRDLLIAFMKSFFS